MRDFFQDGPQLGNQYIEDTCLQRSLQRLLPEDVLFDVEADLKPFGDRVIGDIEAFGEDVHANPPRLVQYDPWGRRIDEIEVARGWTELDKVSAEEGIVATAYERAHGEFSRLHQLAKLYLFHPASAVYSCPLAMTDGAARLIEVHGDDDLRSGVFRRLTSRDPDEFWTSGQWMTERTGGSDVSGTSTHARPDGVGYRLYGTKWFTSATTSQMAMTLARIEDAQGAVIPGSRGLSLFYLETRKIGGELNDIVIHRLKDKLGTKSLPTAELSLEGTPAKLIGQPGEGVKRIATLINVTRIYNASAAVAAMRRAIALARDYARRRKAFGKRLCDHPAHLETLAEMQVELEGALALLMHLGHLMGREECGIATKDEAAVLRILTPVAKLYTAKQAVAVTSEVLESFGGAGYVEDTKLPRLLRDAQVLPIWEGTTNVLSLDVLRSMAREDTLPPLLDHLESMLAEDLPSELDMSRARVQHALEEIRSHAFQAIEEGSEFAEASARRFALSIGRTTIAALLIDNARWSAKHGNDMLPAKVAARWCASELTLLRDAKEAYRSDTAEIAAVQSSPMARPLDGLELLQKHS